VRSLRPTIRSIALVAGALVAFALLAGHVAHGQRFGWDGRLLATIGRVENDAFESTMVAFSFLGAGVGLLLIMTPTLLALLRRKRVADVIFVCTSVLVAQVLGRLAKDGIDDPRPPRPDLEELHALADLRTAVVVIVVSAVLATLATRWRPHALAFSGVLAGSLLVFEVLGPALYPAESRSFPSGHATSSMAFAAAAVTLAWPTRRRWIVAALAAAFTVLVGLSRVALAVHYPSDVLGGWALAIACVALVRLALRFAGPAAGARVSDTAPSPRPRTARRAPAGTASHSPLRAA
jgi:membrane-associated phospholipid phosphatase